MAFPVHDLQLAKEFYSNVLQCEIGRQSKQWMDFNFFGHQITAHLDDTLPQQIHQNEVDSKNIPVRHFGAILAWDVWDSLAERLHQLNVVFYIEPYTRFVGEVGEQRTFFIQDPSGNFLEFKCFQNKDFIFRST